MKVKLSSRNESNSERSQRMRSNSHMLFRLHLLTSQAYGSSARGRAGVLRGSVGERRERLRSRASEPEEGPCRQVFRSTKDPDPEGAMAASARPVGARPPKGRPHPARRSRAPLSRISPLYRLEDRGEGDTMLQRATAVRLANLRPGISLARPPAFRSARWLLARGRGWTCRRRRA